MVVSKVTQAVGGLRSQLEALSKMWAHSVSVGCRVTPKTNPSVQLYCSFRTASCVAMAPASLGALHSVGVPTGVGQVAEDHVGHIAGQRHS
jgi:hypothetical protein